MPSGSSIHILIKPQGSVAGSRMMGTAAAASRAARRGHPVPGSRSSPRARAGRPRARRPRAIPGRRRTPLRDLLGGRTPGRLPGPVCRGRSGGSGPGRGGAGGSGCSERPRHYSIITLSNKGGGQENAQSRPRVEDCSQAWRSRPNAVICRSLAWPRGDTDSRDRDIHLAGGARAGRFTRGRRTTGHRCPASRWRPSPPRAGRTRSDQPTGSMLRSSRLHDAPLPRPGTYRPLSRHPRHQQAARQAATATRHRPPAQPGPPRPAPPRPGPARPGSGEPLKCSFVSTPLNWMPLSRESLLRLEV